jgi:mono/diheme cytochrome c family protein
MYLPVAAGAACFLVGTMIAANAQSSQERGSYLVNAVMACDGCHTPRTGKSLDMSRRFSGGSQVWEEKAYTVRGSNITPDVETGIGSWSAEDFKKALVDGHRPNGIPLAPQMPFPFYKIMTPGDLDAVTAYVRGLKPIRNVVPPPVYRSQADIHLIPGAEKPFAQQTLADPVKRGFYLATLAHCMECHSRKPDGTQDYKNWWGKGGYVFKSRGEVITANITSHKTAGVGSWTDAELKRALTHGVSRDGRPFGPQMQRGEYFSNMTEDDLSAIVAWMRAIPPLE